MTDRDVQREIEENERRARDEQDVGLDEDVVNQTNDDDSIFENTRDFFLDNDNDSEEREVEYNEPDGANRNKPL